MYAGLEVAGVIRSSDGGESWEEITGSLAPNEDTLDLHGVQCTAASPHTVFLTTRQGPFIGPDRGSEWIPIDFGDYSEITYTRDLFAAPHDPNVLFVSIGAAARSSFSFISLTLVQLMFSEIKDTNSSTVACCQASALSAVRLRLSLPKS